MEEMDDQAKQDEVKPKPTVVGIGASAGGLAALRQLFEHIPADSGIAFVVVVHLSPEHKSLLADLLQPCVNFPVQQVTKTVVLEANNVYVIPPNANIDAIDTHLRLSALEEKRRERAPIDHFFRTMAATHDGHSIGVVLTGTGSDGTLGMREIKAKGGVILVQDPNEAEFDGMPQSAISTGLVDRILPIAEIATALVRLAQSERSLEVRNDPKGALEVERVLLPKVLAILRARTDRDFSRYKTATLLRRIGRRMQLNYIDSFAKYVEVVRDQTEEARALADDLLINVTSFFRDAEVFEKLKVDVIPKLFDGKSETDSVRVWSVGCATGEEAYSLAMLLLEERFSRPDPPKIQIFASDLHKRSLESAREGLYPGDIESDVSAARLQRFFLRENGGYRICKEVRDMVVFAPHNLLGDPPFSRLDLIACRNLLIYLERSIQRDVVELFHYALCPHGYLLLGSAETADANELFRTDDKKLCIYEKRNVPAPEPRLPVFPLTRMRRPGERPGVVQSLPVNAAYHSVHRGLLERFAPPSILVGQDNRAVHLSEGVGRYLVLPGGEITSSVLRLVREELRVALQSLLQTARETKQAVDSAEIVVRFDGFRAPVVMHVRPAPDLDQEDFVLVIFEEHQAIRPGASGKLLPMADGAAESQIQALELSLRESRQQLQTIIEEYETSQEEMKAANEEMQSTNEELRSTMEELETSKEELQSINEELQTVNQENRHKVEELSHLSSDLQNLLASTDIATLFLDRDLRILRFTPRLSDIFNVRVTDRGRPISDLTHRLGYQNLREDAREVLDRLVPLEREIEDDRKRWYLTRMLAYRSVENRIEGVVVTFTDITQRKEAEDAMRESEGNLRGVANVVPDLLWYSLPDGSTPWFNDRWLAYTGQGFEHANQWGWADAIHPVDREASIQRYQQAVEQGKQLQQEHRIRKHTGEYRWFLVRAEPRFDPQGRVVRMYGAATDIHDHRLAMEALRESEQKYHLLFTASPAPFLILKPDAPRYTITDVNDAYLAATMRTRDDVVGRGLFEAYPDEPDAIGDGGVSVLRASIERVLTTRQAELLPGLKYKLLRLDGTFEERWWSPINSPVLDEDGQVKAIIYNANDITEERRAQAAMREIDHRYHELFERIDEGFCIIEVLFEEGRAVDYKFVKVNPTFTRHTGIVDPTGRRMREVVPEHEQHWFDIYGEIVTTGQPRRFDAPARALGDRWYEVNAFRVGDAEQRQVAVVFNDVTQRQHDAAALQDSEQRFRLFVENVREYALMQTDVEGVVTSWNPGAERLFGFSSAEVIGQPFSMLLPEEDLNEGQIAREMEALSRGEKVIDAHAVQRKDGSRFWAEWVTEPVLDDSGKLRGTAKVMRDESERQQADNAIRSSLAEKEELLKEVHHRVKNNLQVIVSLLNMQSHQIEDEAVLSQFQEARNRVLAISSIHELLYRAESFAGIVLTDYARQLAPDLIRFYGLGARVALSVEGDGSKLKLERAVPFGMLLNELVSNACKHAFPAPRTGTIVIRVEPDGDALVLTVADDGQGLQNGFEYEKATSLGLKLVHALARQLLGTVESSSAQGTTFRVRFPSTIVEEGV